MRSPFKIHSLPKEGRGREVISCVDRRSDLVILSTERMERQRRTTAVSILVRTMVDKNTRREKGEAKWHRVSSVFQNGILQKKVRNNTKNLTLLCLHCLSY